MKLCSLRIENFRSFKDQKIVFDDYTCLVGANGSGKSTILTALCVLFRETAGSSSDLQTLIREDFHHQDVGKPIRITAVFGDLNDAAKEDLKAYVRQDQLVVSAIAEWDEQTQVASVRQHGQRLVMREFAKYFKADKDGESAAGLKAIFADLREAHDDLPSANTKASMETALRDYEEGHPDLCELEPSEDQFYGWSKGSNKLQKHIQWIFVPAVKDVEDEAEETKQSVLGQLLARTVRSTLSFGDELKEIRDDALTKYRDVLAKQQGALDELSQSLGSRIKQWAHPDADLTVVWRDDDAKAVSVSEPAAVIRFAEGTFKGEIARFGHGLQRSYLLALLQVLAESGDEGQPLLLLGVEEPELFQHPPQARHLSNVLRQLASGNAQVLVCTHSPTFIPGDRLDDVRVLRRREEGGDACVTSCTTADLAAGLAYARESTPQPEMVTTTRIHQCLNPMIREMFFAPSIVMVEGIEDQAYITAWLEITQRWEDFHRLGGHIVPANGKGFMIEPLAVLRQLEIPAFVVFDGDSDETRPEARSKHENDNKAILRLCDVENAEAMRESCLKTDRLVMWADNIGARVSESLGESEWQQAQERARSKYNLFAKSMKKNPLFIGFSLEEVRLASVECPVLDDLCDRIILFMTAPSRTESLSCHNRQETERHPS